MSEKKMVWARGTYGLIGNDAASSKRLILEWADQMCDQPHLRQLYMALMNVLGEGKLDDLFNLDKLVKSYETCQPRNPTIDAFTAMLKDFQKALREVLDAHPDIKCLDH